MTLQQLAFFMAIYRHGSFTMAANELCVSQSSLSKQILALEKELGTELFIRSTRRLKLSPMGEQLLPHVTRMVNAYENMKRCAALDRRNAEGVIRVGGVPVLSIYGITEALLQFELLNPELRLEVQETTTSEILNGLADHALDIGIGRFSLPLDQDSQSFQVVPLVDDQQVLVVPPDHSLAQSKETALSQMSGETFVQLNTDPLVSAYHLQQLETFCPNVSFHLSNMKMDSIKECVLQRGWVSLVMHQVAQKVFEPEAKIVFLKDSLRLTLCAIFRKDDDNEKTRMLVRFLTAHFAGQTIFQ